jgi:peptide/nickel transport system ATP-binding protein
VKNTENLLSIVRLKKYFPLAKKSVFSRKRQYLRANESVSFSVGKGETFAIVGESGCGKSTLGKTVLQLYAPTDGGVYYYGKTIDEILPKYIFTMLKNAKKYRVAYQKTPDLASEPIDIEFWTALKLFGGLLSASESDFLTGVQALNARFQALKNGQDTKVAEENLQEVLSRVKETPVGRALERRKDNAVELSRLTGKEMRTIRKDLQIIFQDPYSSLNPRMTVGQIIEEGATTHGYFKTGSAQLREYTLGIMRSCGLEPHFYTRYPHQFSGGQRQRVCIARALALKPRFVVCDECVSALDSSIQSQILNLLNDLKKEQGLTYLFISHDLSVVRYISDRVAVMYLGETVETGATEDLFENPRHPYTISLISAAPTTAQSATDEKILPTGNIPSPVSPPSGCKYHTRCFMAQEKCKTQIPPLVEVEKGHFTACHFANIPTQKKREIAKKN